MIEELIERFEGRKKSYIAELYLDDILPNPTQPRRYFDKESLLNLSHSIKRYGVIQPITVRKVGEQYYIISGERRYRAAYMAGLETIPSVVTFMNDEMSALVSVESNLHRENLCFFEEAESFSAISEKFGLSYDDIARKFGMRKTSIMNKLRLLKLPKRVRKIIRDNHLTQRHAGALLAIDGENAQAKAAMRMVYESMSPQQAEVFVSEMGMTQQYKSVTGGINGIRMITNTIKRAVDAVRKGGFYASVEQMESDSDIEYVITVKK